MLDCDNRAGIELYMSLQGKADLKVEEVVMNAKGTSDLSGMWNALDCAFLFIDHRESRYRQTQQDDGAPVSK